MARMLDVSRGGPLELFREPLEELYHCNDCKEERGEHDSRHERHPKFKGSDVYPCGETPDYLSGIMGHGGLSPSWAGWECCHHPPMSASSLEVGPS